MFYYLPLEPYVERYTYLMSKRGGWAESHFANQSVPFRRIEGDKQTSRITTGSVLDAYGRSRWAMSQTTTVLNLLEEGTIKDGDVIYTEDFWHPGIESLFYVREITGVDFKVGCFMHAQSIDPSDFTRPMRRWLGDIEKGMSKGYDYVFVTSRILKDLATEAGWDRKNIHLTGLPYNEVMLLAEYGHLIREKKDPFVLFSSRFDLEKNPTFFLDLVAACPNIDFKLVKPRERLSNSKRVEYLAKRMHEKFTNFEIVDTSTKEKYYDLLGRAEVQFNCAIQDWVSWTLLEGITFGCKPLYPIWKDFPDELSDHPESLYENKSLSSAINALNKLMDKNVSKNLRSIPIRHDESWKKKLEIMGLIK